MSNRCLGLIDTRQGINTSCRNRFGWQTLHQDANCPWQRSWNSPCFCFSAVVLCHHWPSVLVAESCPLFLDIRFHCHLRCTSYILTLLISSSSSTSTEVPLSCSTILPSNNLLPYFSPPITIISHIIPSGHQHLLSQQNPCCGTMVRFGAQALLVWKFLHIQAPIMPGDLGSSPPHTYKSL